MSYKEFIDSILQTRGRFMYDDEYHERHHIIPKCKNGSDKEENLIDLFAMEHFIAHKLLAEENPDDDKLAHAYALMAFVKDKNQKRYELTPEEYEEARKVYSEKFSGYKNPSARRVIRLCDDKIYDTVKDCYVDNNISNTTMWEMLKIHRDFMYYDEYINTSESKLQEIKSINWDEVCHTNRSKAAKKSGRGGSTFRSEETRKKIGAARKKNGISVYCPQLDECFITMREAENKYNICKGCIKACLVGEQKHAGKHPVTGEPLSWVKLENKNC